MYPRWMPMETTCFPHPVRDRYILWTLPGTLQGGSLADILLDTPARFHPLRLAGEENSSVRVSRRAISSTQDYLSSWLNSCHTPDLRAHSSPLSGSMFDVGALSKGPPSPNPGRSLAWGTGIFRRRTWPCLLGPPLGLSPTHLRMQTGNLEEASRGPDLTVGTHEMVSSMMISPSVSLPNKGCFHISLTLLL